MLFAFTILLWLFWVFFFGVSCFFLLLCSEIGIILSYYEYLCSWLFWDIGPLSVVGVYCVSRYFWCTMADRFHEYLMFKYPAEAQIVRYDNEARFDYLFGLLSFGLFVISGTFISKISNRISLFVLLMMSYSNFLYASCCWRIVSLLFDHY